MPPTSSRTSLWGVLEASGNLRDRSLFGAHACVSLGELERGSAFDGRMETFRGRAVLIATTDQFTAALAVLELDGVARRLVLVPPDLPPQHLAFVIDSAEVDTIVFDGDSPPSDECRRVPYLVECNSKITPATVDRVPSCETEWILLTSGTTGVPKLVVHTLSSLAGAIKPIGSTDSPIVWSTFYDIRRYGGLQILLRTVFTAGSMVLSHGPEPVSDYLERAGAHGVTHILGTPSHWRRAIMSTSLHEVSPRYIRLSGEIVDQAILSHLRSHFPQASIAHAFASTEAGVGFEVNDCLAGFPASFVRPQDNGVEVKIESGSLRIRSTRNAARYLGPKSEPVKDTEGFVDTGDMVELRGDRYYFVGRRDGVINVGGLKVHPEEVEAVINQHPRVQMSLVRKRKNPVTGAVVVADIVLDEAPDTPEDQAEQVKRELFQLCQNVLPRHKIPASLNVVPSLAVMASGKMARHDA